jgi:leucyl aminopeptidase
MLGSTSVFALLLLHFSQLGHASQFQSPEQVVLAPAPLHTVNEDILAALRTHADPVDALVSLNPQAAAPLAAPRLLHIFGQEKAEWLTAGDKMRLRRAGQKFMDITDHEAFYSQQLEASTAGKACEFCLFNALCTMHYALCTWLTIDQTYPNLRTRA